MHRTRTQRQEPTAPQIPNQHLEQGPRGRKLIILFFLISLKYKDFWSKLEDGKLSIMKLRHSFKFHYSSNIYTWPGAHSPMIIIGSSHHNLHGWDPPSHFPPQCRDHCSVCKRCLSPAAPSSWLEPFHAVITASHYSEDHEVYPPMASIHHCFFHMKLEQHKKTLKHSKINALHTLIWREV